MKTCPKCKKSKLSSEFGKNKSKKDGLQSQCKRCKRETQAAWYQTHKETHNQRTNTRRKQYSIKLRQFVWDYLLVHPCLDCGESDPVVLDFDHVRGKKVDNISSMVYKEVPLNKLKQEIVKCEVRCRNCHIRRTAVQFNWYSTIDLRR